MIIAVTSQQQSNKSKRTLISLESPMSDILSIDFDGTIVGHAFPRIGEPLPRAFETLIDLKDAGYRLILNTCREDCGFEINKQYLTNAIEFCKENGVEFDSHNENSEELEFRDMKYLRRKVYADYYIDDRNIGGFLGWDYVRLFFGLDGVSLVDPLSEVMRLASVIKMCHNPASRTLSREYVIVSCEFCSASRNFKYGMNIENDVVHSLNCPFSPDYLKQFGYVK